MLSYITAVEEQRTVCTTSEGELLVLDILKSLFTCLSFNYFFIIWARPLIFYLPRLNIDYKHFLTSKRPEV